jgi:hypothetical protein
MQLQIFEFSTRYLKIDIQNSKFRCKIWSDVFNILFTVNRFMFSHEVSPWDLLISYTDDYYDRFEYDIVIISNILHVE